MDYSGTAVGAVILGLTLPCVGNIFFRKRRAKDRAIQRHGDSLIRLLHHAETNKQAIAVTLRNRKWYVGMVAESPNLEPHEVYFRLLPLLSGYREVESLRVKPIVYYKFPDSMQVNSKDLVVTLPIAEVQSASLFDIGLYDSFFARDGENRSQSGDLLPEQIDIPETHYS